MGALCVGSLGPPAPSDAFGCGNGVHFQLHGSLLGASFLSVSEEVDCDLADLVGPVLRLLPLNANFIGCDCHGRSRV